VRIAYLSADPGIPIFGNTGASVHIREFVNALATLGHEITVLAATRGTGSGALRAEVIQASAQSLSVSTNAIAGVWLETALGRARRSVLVSSMMLECLMNLHARWRFDLIYERYSLWSPAGVRAAQKLRVPCLVEVNAPLVEEARKDRALVLASGAEVIEAEVFSGAHLLLTVSEPLKAYAVTRGADPQRTFVLPNGVDVERFHPAVEPESLEGATGKFVIGFAGSFEISHGLDLLVEAFQTLRGHSAAYHLLLVGDGALRSWIEGYLRGARLEPMVTITGWVAADRLPGLIQRMDIAVAPYPFLDGFYFSPLTLFEYLAVGKPVVASRIGQIPEIIQHGTTGLLARPGDTQDLVHTIERLRHDPRLRQHLGHAASREARHHTWEHNARRVMTLADPLVSAKARRLEE
jgi:glycosyltransferase involved in cell wall biosynthesis